MGEYAIRKSDNTEVKIGTCEDMYYLRYEDREKVRKMDHSLDPSKEFGLRFRLPFPDEDGVPIGEYDDYNRGLRLYRTVLAGTPSAVTEDFSDESTVDDPGVIQLRHEASGMLINVPCYHGHKLPEVSKPMQIFWNGKGYSLVLSSVKAVEVEGGGVEVKPVVRCRHCNHAWRYEWSDVMEYIEPAMRARLEVYAKMAVAV